MSKTIPAPKVTASQATAPKRLPSQGGSYVVDGKGELQRKEHTGPAPAHKPGAAAQEPEA